MKSTVKTIKVRKSGEIVVVKQETGKVYIGVEDYAGTYSCLGGLDAKEVKKLIEALQKVCPVG